MSRSQVFASLLSRSLQSEGLKCWKDLFFNCSDEKGKSKCKTKKILFLFKRKKNNQHVSENTSSRNFVVTMIILMWEKKSL